MKVQPRRLKWVVENATFQTEKVETLRFFVPKVRCVEFPPLRTYPKGIIMNTLDVTPACTCTNVKLCGLCRDAAYREHETGEPSMIFNYCQECQLAYCSPTFQGDRCRKCRGARIRLTPKQVTRMRKKMNRELKRRAIERGSKRSNVQFHNSFFTC